MTHLQRTIIALRVSVALSAIAPTPLLGQEDHADEDHHLHHNHIALFVGGTTPLDSASGGATSFTLGADYERRITPVLGALLLVDFAIGDHKRAALFGAMFAVRPIEPLRITVGTGFELVDKDVTSGGTTTTKKKAFFVIPTRASYEFHVGKLTLAPTFGMDFVGETKTNIVYGLSLGYGF